MVFTTFLTKQHGNLLFIVFLDSYFIIDIYLVTQLLDCCCFGLPLRKRALVSNTLSIKSA